MPNNLYVPKTPFRPGDTPDFSHLKIPEAGILERPSVLVNVSEVRDLPYNMIRVLNGDHSAVGDWDPKLTPDQLRDGLRYMLLTRAFDERMFKMQRQGKLSFYVKSTGEEAIPVAQGMALRSDDMLFPSYRQQALLIIRGISLVDMMCQCLSNSRDNLGGHQIPILYSWKEANFFTISGNVCTQFPQAVGWAMASAYKGDDQIAASWIGEGSTAEQDFHYALTFAGVYRAPVILNVVNNQWAISSHQNIAGGKDTPFATRSLGHSFPGLRVDGNDFLAVYAASAWAIERARQGGGPTLIEHYTYRAGGHSTSDDPGRYRAKNEWDHWPLGDPVERLKQHLIQLSEWSEQQHRELINELHEQVRSAWTEAVSYGTLADGQGQPGKAMFDHVYKEVLPHLEEQQQEYKDRSWHK